MTQITQNYRNTWVEIANLKTIGTLLRGKRKQMGLSQSDAAGLCNVGIRFISELENGKSTMHFDKVLKVLKRFGFTISMREKWWCYLYDWAYIFTTPYPDYCGSMTIAGFPSSMTLTTWKIRTQFHYHCCYRWGKSRIQMIHPDPFSAIFRRNCAELSYQHSAKGIFICVQIRAKHYSLTIWHNYVIIKPEKSERYNLWNISSLLNLETRLRNSLTK